MSAKLPTLIRRDWLDVGEGHLLHLAQYGNPDGIPLLYLHGGPGGGCSSVDLELYDADTYHLFMLDQRGSGRSKPAGALTYNNLQALVDDIERVRLYLQIPAWCLSGGSFGATVGLIYSGLYPTRVLSQVYWGLFVPNTAGINWLYGPEGAASMFPKAYQVFARTEGTQAKLLANYHRGLHHPNGDIRYQYVQAWLEWELSLSLPGSQMTDSCVAMGSNLAKIEVHFACYDYFAGHALMQRACDKVQALTLVLQGELDWVCPVHILDDFINQSQGLLQYQLVDGAHHSLADQTMYLEVIDAIRRMAAYLQLEQVNQNK